MTDSPETDCPDFTVRTVPLGGGALSRAIQSGEASVQPWIVQQPHTADEWRQRVSKVRSEFQGRDWLQPLLPAFGASGAAAARLARAAKEGVVVTTGQQPGLFGGPMYTISKAMSALAFADELQSLTGIPVAPVFWAANDDSDWLEAAVTHVVGRRGLETLKLVGPASNGVAMSRVPLGDTAQLYNSLLQASGSGAWSEVLEYARDAYVPHATIGDAYLQLMRALLEPLGMAVVDASHISLRTTADPFLRSALTNAASVHAALVGNQEAIKTSGFAPQVDVMDALSLVFRTSLDSTGTPIRERVPISDATRTVREAESGTLGSNVLLRPVLERQLLPTVAYHAGPGELAYFAQVTAVARALDVSAPLGVPRWAGEVVSSDAVRAMNRLGIDETILRDPHQAEQQIAREAISEDVSDAIERLRLAIETQCRVLADAVERTSLTAETVPAGALRDLQWKVSRLERRLLAAARNRETSKMQDLNFARGVLFPGGKSPERVLNALPYLARYGSALLDAMRARAKEHARELIGVVRSDSEPQHAVSGHPA